MPIRRKAFSFKGKVNITPRKPPTELSAAVSTEEVHPIVDTELTEVDKGTYVWRTRLRTRSFIAKKVNQKEKAVGQGRDSVCLRSFRKRKMADRDEDGENKPEQKQKTRKLSSLDQEDIQNKITDQIRMRDGVMKLMSACSTFRQTIDASKNYLTINARVLALMSALQKKKSELVLMEYNKRNSEGDVNNLKPCAGTLLISDIRIPLMWKDGAHFRSKTGEQLYFMFCLLKHGNHVYDTSLKQVDVSDTDVNFDEIVRFDNVDADFKLHFEIYYTVTHNPDHHAVAPIRTPRKGGQTFSAPNYCLAGHMQFSIADVKGSTSTFDLAMGGKGASATTALGQAHELPDNELALWGQICCALSAQPMCMTDDQISGTVSLQATTATTQQQWTEHYCILRKASIDCWKMPYNQDVDGDKICDYSIKMKPTMNISQPKLPELKQDHLLIITSSGEENEPVLAFSNEDDMNRWKIALKQEIVNCSAWRSACERFMQPKPLLKSLIQVTSTRLYDQIKMDDVDEKPTVTPSPSSLSRQSSGSPTSPITNGKHIDEAIEINNTNKTEAVKVNDEANTEIDNNSKTESRPDGNEPPKEIIKVQTEV